MPNIRLLIADDHPLFRRGVINALAALSDLEVVGEAATGLEAVNLAQSVTPDVLLLELHMPVLNGLDTMRAIRATNTAVRFLVLTMFDDDYSVHAALRAGAQGYLLKGADQQELERAIRAIYNGGAIFSAPIAQRLLQQFSEPESPSDTFYLPELTRRETQVLMLIAQGRTNDQIADLLGLHLKSVRNNVSTIFNKLQVADRAQAIERAHAIGLH